MTNLQFINILREFLGKEPIKYEADKREPGLKSVTLSLVCDCGQTFRTQASRRSHTLYNQRVGRKCG